MRTSSVLALVAWAVLVPGAMRAGDLTIAIDGSAEYDSNAFRSSDDEKEDVLFRLRPSLRLHDDRGQDLRYSLEYGLPVELAAIHSELNDVDQDLFGDFDYHANDRLSIFGSNQFRYLRSELRTSGDNLQSAGDGLMINEERDRVTMNDALVGTSYQFTPRLEGTALLEHNYFNPSRDDRAENWELEGTARMLYTLTPKFRLGGGAMVAHQEFDETQDITASTTDIYNVFGSFRWAINAITELEVSGGPSVIRVEQDDPPGSETRGIVPFQRMGAFNAGSGFIDRNGDPVDQGDAFPSGSLLVSTIGNCQQLNDGTPVLTSGRNCPFNVILDATAGADDDLIAQIESQANIVNLVNVDPHGDEATSVNGFANVVLTRHWTPNLHTALRYTREQGNGSGLGGTVIGDSITLSNTWNLTEKWQLWGRAEWGLRKSVEESTRFVTVAEQVTSPLGGAAFAIPLAGVSNAPGPSPASDGILLTQRSDETNVDTMRWGLAGRGTYFLTRNTSGYVQLTYNQQSSTSDSLGDPSDFDDFLATIGITHVFEPIKLW